MIHNDTEGTPGIAGIDFGAGSSSPFGGGLEINPDEIPDSWGGVVDAAGDVIQERGGEIAGSFLEEIGINQTSGGSPSGNQGLNFSAPTGGQSAPVEPVQTGGMFSGFSGVAIIGLGLLTVLFATDTIDL